MTTETEVEVHGCTTGKFKFEIIGPFYRGSFSEGQLYRGERQYWREQCDQCQFVNWTGVGTFPRGGYSVTELMLFGAQWFSKPEVFGRTQESGSPPGWPYEMPEERAQEIEAWYRRETETMPASWGTHPVSATSGGRMRKKRGS